MTNDETRFHALKFALQYFDALDIGAGPECVIQAAEMFNSFLDGRDPVTAPQVQAEDVGPAAGPADEPNDWIDESFEATKGILADVDPELADLTESYPLNDWVSELPDEPVAQADSPQEVPAAVDLSPEETQFFANIYAAAAEPQPEPEPEAFSVVMPVPTEAEITDAVEAIASSPPPAPDASDEDEMTDDQVERAEDRLRDPVANFQTQLLSAGQALSSGSVLADASNTENSASPYVNVVRTKWPWMP